MQMNRVCFVALVIEAKAVPGISAHVNGIGLGERFTVDGPVIDPAIAREFLAEDEGHDAARGFGSLRLLPSLLPSFLPKNRIVPCGIRRRGPLRRSVAVRIFHHNPQPGIAYSIVSLAENPHARLVHGDDSVYALRRTHLDRIHLARYGHGVSVQAEDFELVTGQRNSVLIGGAGIQHAKQHLLPFLHAHRIARAERVTVHGINRVSDFKVAFVALAIEICFPPMQREKNLRVVLTGLFFRFNVEKSELSRVRGSFHIPAGVNVAVIPAGPGGTRDKRISPDSACGHHRRSLFLGTIHLGGNE